MSLIDNYIHFMNIFIAFFTSLGCFICVIIYSYWWYILTSEIKLRLHFLGVSFVMFGLCGWTASQVYYLLMENGFLPHITMIWRLYIFIGVWFKVIVATRIKPV